MNRRGYATLLAMIVAPLMVSALAAIAASYFVFRDDTRVRHACRIELLKIQNAIAEDLNRLIALNAEARRLRVARKLSDAARLAAITPPQRAAAEAGALKVAARQAVLATRQRALVASMRLRSSAGPRMAARRIESALRLERSSRRPTDFRAVSVGAELLLLASPPDSPTPNYEPAANLAERQVMSVSWKFSLEPILPEWLVPFVKPFSLRSSGECRATLEKEEEKWRPRLVADKL